jgi:hypothetical protein
MDLGGGSSHCRINCRHDVWYDENLCEGLETMDAMVQLRKSKNFRWNLGNPSLNAGVPFAYDCANRYHACGQRHYESCNGCFGIAGRRLRLQGAMGTRHVVPIAGFGRVSRLIC